MNMSSGFIGNLIAYLLFDGDDEIDKNTRMTLGWILTSVSAAGSKPNSHHSAKETNFYLVALVAFLFRPTPWAEKPTANFLQTLKDSWALYITPNMMMFSLTMVFTGLSQSLWAGVYSAKIGYTIG